MLYYGDMLASPVLINMILRGGRRQNNGIIQHKIRLTPEQTTAVQEALAEGKTVTIHIEI